LGTAPGSRTKLLRFRLWIRCHFERLVARSWLGRHFVCADGYSTSIDCTSRQFAAEEAPKVHFIRVGTARQRYELVPKVQIWFRSAQAWIADLGSIRKIEKQ
jgi:hypothetical protein